MIERTVKFKHCAAVYEDQNKLQFDIFQMNFEASSLILTQYHFFKDVYKTHGDHNWPVGRTLQPLV